MKECEYPIKQTEPSPPCPPNTKNTTLEGGNLVTSHYHVLEKEKKGSCVPGMGECDYVLKDS